MATFKALTLLMFEAVPQLSVTFVVPFPVPRLVTFQCSNESIKQSSFSSLKILVLRYPLSVAL